MHGTQYVTLMHGKDGKELAKHTAAGLDHYRTVNMVEIPPFSPINLPLVRGCQSIVQDVYGFKC